VTATADQTKRFESGITRYYLVLPTDPEPETVFFTPFATQDTAITINVGTLS
jgi:hypothetical protein